MHLKMNGIQVKFGPRDFMDREVIMKQWDEWREYIANGGKGSWPRDAFEALLDSFEEQLEADVLKLHE